MTLTIIPFENGTPGQASEVDTAGLRSALAQPGALLWIDIGQPQADDFEQLQEVLGLPPLAVESAREARQRPKLDMYEDFALLVAYAVTVAKGSRRGHLHLEEVSLFVGRDYLLTVRQGKVGPGDTIHRWLLNTEGRRMHSSTALTHAVLDSIIDGYFVATEAIEERIEVVDAKVWGGLNEAELAEAFALRRDLVRFRRVVGPLRETLNAMARHNGGVFDDSVDEHLRDLYDHTLTVYEDIEVSRELLAGDLEAHLSAISNRMNEVVLKVSAWAAIIAIPTVIASIYGMNFRRMPELHWGFGYPMAIGMMVIAAIALYLAFRRQHWL